MKVGIYCRVSGDKQKDNTSLSSQKEMGIKFCKEKNYKYEIFSEVVSGKMIGSNREMFSKLETKLLNGEIGGIWLYDWDRMVRDVEVMLYFRSIVEDSGCKVFVGFEEKNIFEDSGSLEFGIRSIFSDYERRKIQRRMMNGRDTKWREGKGLSNVGFGYEKNKDGVVVINKEESEVIKDIYNTYLRKDVKFYTEVEKRILNKYGKVVNGKRINGGLVERVLGNEKYKGVLTITSMKGEKFTFDIGRIIEDEVYDKVTQKKGRMKSLRSVNMKEDYLLKGKVFCGDCDTTMWIKGGGKIVNGSVYRYYYCNDRERKKKYDKKFDKYVIEMNKIKPNRKFDLTEYEKKYGKFTKCLSEKSNTISRNNLEKIVWDSLYEFLNESDDIKKEYKKRYEDNLGGKDRIYNKLSYYDKEIEKLEGRKSKFLSLWVDGEVTDKDKEVWIEKEYNQKKIKFSKKVNDLEKELSKYTNSSKIDGWMDLMREDLLKEYNIQRFENRRQIIEKYIDWVKIKYNGKDEEYKTYEILIKVLLGDKPKFVGVGVTKNKKSYLMKDNSIYKVKLKDVKVSDLLYKNQLSIIIHKCIKISLNGDRVVNNTKNKVIYC